MHPTTRLTAKRLGGFGQNRAVMLDVETNKLCVKGTKKWVDEMVDKNGSGRLI